MRVVVRGRMADDGWRGKIASRFGAWLPRSWHFELLSSAGTEQAFLPGTMSSMKSMHLHRRPFRATLAMGEIIIPCKREDDYMALLTR